MNIVFIVRSLQDFYPVIDSVTEKVIHIDFPPMYKKSSDGAFKATGLDYNLTSGSTAPPDLSTDPLKASNRERVPPPLGRHDFLPDLIEENLAKEGKKFKLRDDLKPLHVVQPEGVSFKVTGHEIEWQKWKLHACMSHHVKLRMRFFPLRS